MYSIELTKSSKKFLKKLDLVNKKMIIHKLNLIKKEPFSYLKKLKGNKLWRLRIGKYRLILDVLISGKRIIVLRIGLRKKIYKN